jgi:chromosomal replication initiation ATPase DnaA
MQYVLPFQHSPQYDAADFLPADCNAEALTFLHHTPDWPQRRLALWGPAGCGKTHLLHLWTQREGALLIAGPSLRLAPPERPLAIDDADTAPERPLLHTLNAAFETGLPVLLAGRDPPARWLVRLPDLASRLRAITAAQIRPADDGLLRALLARLLVERQMTVSEPVQQFLLHHLPRTPGAIREAAARLDHASFAAGGRANRAVAAAVLAGMTGFDENFTTPSTNGSSAAPLLL